MPILGSIPPAPTSGAEKSKSTPSSNRRKMLSLVASFMAHNLSTAHSNILACGLNSDNGPPLLYLQYGSTRRDRIFWKKAPNLLAGGELALGGTWRSIAQPSLASDLSASERVSFKNLLRSTGWFAVALLARRGRVHRRWLGFAFSLHGISLTHFQYGCRALCLEGPQTSHRIRNASEPCVQFR